MQQEAYIIDGYRTAIGKSIRGTFKNTRSDDLAVAVIKHLMEQYPQLDPQRIDDLIVGCAYPEGEQGMQMGRLISLMSLPMNVPGYIVNRFCGSGLEAIAIATQRIQAGMADIIIAGGAESMSIVPRNGYKLSPNPYLVENHPDYLINMGLTAENVAEKYNISRDRQDEFSLHSHQKAAKSQESGFFAPEIVPFTVEETLLDEAGKKTTRSTTLQHDESIRPSTTLEALKNLKPAFKEGGIVTPGNSSPMNDGAAFALIVSEKVANELNLKPKAKMLSYAAVGVHPAYMGIGPVEAVPKALEKANLKLNDLDAIELNEAFAAQALAVMDQLHLNPELVNVNGGAIALGHPLGATGAKLTIHLTRLMEQAQLKYGMVTACVGGGQGVAGIFERLS